MKIRYKNNDATQIPTFMSGTCIEIKQWLRGKSFDEFIKKVYAPKKCIACGDPEAERCGGALCNSCWIDSEVFTDEDYNE